jgi:hypothetical protein
MGLFRRRRLRTSLPRPAGAPGDAVCHACGAEAVIPVRWQELESNEWWMRLRCGNCGEVCELVLSDAAAEALDQAIDLGVGKIRRSLLRLEREAMEREPE